MSTKVVINKSPKYKLSVFDGAEQSLFIINEVELKTTANINIQRLQLLNDLVAYWKLDETSGTRYDSHGSYDLTENGSIDSGIGVKENCAVSNSTYNDGKSLTISPSPYDSVGASWSLSFWISTNDNNDDTFHIFPNAWGNCVLFEILTINGDKIVQGRLWKDGESGGTDTDISKSGLYAGGFVHVAITHDLPTKTVRVYYDGTKEHVVTYTTSLNSVSGTGGGENTILSMFAGDLSGINFAGPAKLDEVGIWQRVLTDGEIEALYNNGDGITYEEFNSFF